MGCGPSSSPAPEAKAPLNTATGAADTSVHSDVPPGKAKHKDASLVSNATSFTDNAHDTPRSAARKMAVTTGADVVPGEFQKVTHDKPEATANFLVESLGDASMFSDLDEVVRQELVDQMSPVDCLAESVVIEEGDEGDKVYVVESGEYHVFFKASGAEVRDTFREGKVFGELAILHDAPRSATVKCVSPGRIWALDRRAFRATVTASATIANETFLASVDVLSSLSSAQRSGLARVMQQQTYQAGDVIVKVGAIADAIYFIKSGEVAVHQRDLNDPLDPREDLLRLGTGAFFGESAINNLGLGSESERRSSASVKEDIKRTANVQAVNKVVALRLLAKDFHDLVGDLKGALERNFSLKVIDSIPLFEPLTVKQREDFAGKLTEVRFPKGHIIQDEGEQGDTFYIVKAGQVLIFNPVRGLNRKERSIATIGPAGYFGERAMLTKEKISASVRVLTSEVVLYSISYATFTAELGSLQEITENIAEEVRRKDQLNSQKRMTLWQLEQKRTLGVGTFGRVKLVRDPKTNTPYALKILDKRQVVHMKQETHVMQEKTLLALCRHPFICDLVATFQDADHLYMLLEYCNGGELFSRLQETGPMHNDDARFYVACIVSAFSYLHQRRIAYRDLKPENIILDTSGFARLVDFGFAKQVLDRTLTLCGTPEYLAPEIILNKSHDIGVDWWTVGILTYELLSGRPPFVDPDPMGLYEQIIRGKVRYPSKFTKEATSLMKKLIVTNPVARIGASTQGQEVKDHPFFAEVDWDQLQKMKVATPWKPNVKDPFDAKHFDAYEESDAEKKRQYRNVVVPRGAFENF